MINENRTLLLCCLAVFFYLFVVEQWGVAQIDVDRLVKEKEFPCQSEFVNSLSFAPDGVRLVGGTKDGNVVVWDVTTGSVVYRLQGHRGNVWQVEVSPDGKFVGSAGGDETVRLWGTRTGQEMRVLEKAGCFAVAFSPDSQIIAASDCDNEIHLWSTRSGKLLQSPDFFGEPLAFSPDGTLLAIGGGGGTTGLVSVQTGEMVSSLKKGGAEVKSVAWSPEGALLASGKWNGFALMWDARTGELLQTLRDDHLEGKVKVAFSRDGKTLLGTSVQGYLIFWDSSTGEKLGELPDLWSFALSPDGKRLAGYGGHSIKTWLLQ